ncbi:cryptochrome/photolyase family protein [Mucisphaera calidilacus]|uniref:Deoxyribodipyrimidine photo-lyase n=1 Tax=Mucisphaera calidilacus TaxID=2527982 RepID=A0A518BVK1_9BACT|nr:deoxyribodipyrimidine photo-lyase [Mucisphaera calidilacus]QDU70977.1 Deoxyribodipyrimidine photo-lyase [Mucisphaera calidilacus]
MSDGTIVWLRRDLRLSDQPALRFAIERGGPVIPVYIESFKEEGRWAPGGAHRWWLHESLGSLASDLEGVGSRLVIRRGEALAQLRALVKETGADAVVWCRRYEPLVIERDKAVKSSLCEEGVTVETFNGSLLFEPWTVMNQQEKPYQVYSPFSRNALDQDEPERPLSRPRKLESPESWPESLGIDDLGLLPEVKWYQRMAEVWEPGEKGARKRLKAFVGERSVDYKSERDRPDLEGTSRLSPYLHHGELSPRQAWHAVLDGLPEGSSRRDVMKYLKELLWREFGYHLLYHFPQTPERPLREKYASFPWRDAPQDLRAWQKGQTGYPIVDAGMRQLWATGWMHNRVRMIVASVLVKQLLITWEEGAAWFWDTLVDGDLANNTLGWQWAGGCGADAAPYFRVFNPVLQGEKFDPEGAYTRLWVPELKEVPQKWLFKPWEAPKEVLEQAGVQLGQTYPEPIVDPKAGRERALEAFEVVKG